MGIRKKNIEKGHKFSGMGRLKIFVVNGKKLKNMLVLGVPKVLQEDVNKNYVEKNHRGIRNHKLRKVKNFQVRVA